MKRISAPRSLDLCLLFVIALLIAVSAMTIVVTGPQNSRPAAAASGTTGLWVFGGSITPNPVSTVEGRDRLVTGADSRGIDEIYISTFRPEPSSTGRYMYEDADMAALNAAAHAAGIEVWVAHGNPDWPTFGCTSSDRPVQRMQDIVNYNAAVSPNERFDGVMLDVEPGPMDADQFRDYIAMHECIRSVLPLDIKLGTAINAFWHDEIEYPVGGPVKPVYGHIVDLEIDSIVVMGYRDFAGDDNCPASNGVVCLIKDEVEYASAQGRTGLVRSGLETMNVAPGQPEHVTFYEEGEQLMNSELKIVDAYFSKASGFGGFAIHNYSMAYLSGTEGWPYFAPTSAPVSIGGRVVTSSGHGISGARLTLTVSGEARHAVTNAFGYYRFTALPAGAFAVISVAAKGRNFANPTRFISVQEDIVDLDFTAYR